MEKHILIVDDIESELKGIADILEAEGYNILTAMSGKEAIRKLKKKPVPLVLSDLKMPEMDGYELLKRIKSTNSKTEVMIITGYATVKSAVECMKEGALWYFEKPLKIDEIIIKLEEFFDSKNEIPEIKFFYSDNQVTNETNSDKLVGSSRKMKIIYKLISKLANIPISVLLLGETGTGKELVARNIHYSSNRKDKPFVKVSCPSLTPSLVESELFGYEKGAFTGADKQKKGRFELAHQGTIFLDEIAEISLELQSKFLQILDKHSFERVGGAQTIYVDIRIITATNKNLEKCVEQGAFRNDLYQRLSEVVISIPPLRDRKEDIPILVEYFIEKFNNLFKKEVQGITNEAAEFLMNYDFSGNVRELKNMIKKSVCLMETGLLTKKVLTQNSSFNINNVVEDFSPVNNVVNSFSPGNNVAEDSIYGNLNINNSSSFPLEQDTERKLILENTLESYEKQKIENQLKECYGKRKIAAEKLGISLATLWRKIKKHKIEN